MMAKRPISYAVLRGKVIKSDLIEFGGRGGDLTFLAPDPHKIASQIPLYAMLIQVENRSIPR